MNASVKKGLKIVAILATVGVVGWVGYEIYKKITSSDKKKKAERKIIIERT